MAAYQTSLVSLVSDSLRNSSLTLKRSRGERYRTHRARFSRHLTTSPIHTQGLQSSVQFSHWRSHGHTDQHRLRTVYMEEQRLPNQTLPTAGLRQPARGKGRASPRRPHCRRAPHLDQALWPQHEGCRHTPVGEPEPKPITHGPACGTRR